MRIVYDDTDETLRLVLKAYGSPDLEVVCPVCGAEMMIVPDRAAAARSGMHPGVYCPERHVFTMLNLGPGLSEFFDAHTKDLE